MSSFSEVMQDLVNLDTEQKLELAADSYLRLLPELKKFDEKTSGFSLVCAIMGSAIAADGKVSVEEHAIMKAILAASGLKLSDDDISEMIKISSSKNAYKMVKDVADALPMEASVDLTTLVAAICSIDDRISSEESAYISALLS